jgi:hypothetical protein
LSDDSTTDARNGLKQFRPEYVGRVKRYGLLGLTEAQAREAFGMTVFYWRKWRKLHPEFAEAWDNAAFEADGRVVEGLYKRATGFTKRGLRKHMAAGGVLNLVEYDEYYPPDVGAGLAWLKVRQPETWGKALAAPKPADNPQPREGGNLTVYVDADTLALCGAPMPQPMKDVTPAA